MSTAVVQLKYLNLAMMHFGASEVVPVYYVLFTFFSIRESLRWPFLLVCVPAG